MENEKVVTRDLKFDERKSDEGERRELLKHMEHENRDKVFLG